nr:hypothetical protein [Tanacetum cinerariifolium]
MILPLVMTSQVMRSEFNPIHNEDLDSTPKNVCFDTKSYLLESLLNRDESIPPGIDCDDSDFEGDNLFLERLLHDDPIPLPDTLDFSIDCQPKNHDNYHEQNYCYDSNSFDFDHGQPPRYTVNHPIFNAHNDLLSSRTMLMEQMTQLTSMCEMFCQFIQKKQEEKRIEEEQAANAQYWKIPACCDDDDDYNSAITPNEPVDSLGMGDEHLDTILATELDEFIKSYVENLVPNPSESEGENGCDVPACFTTFSNILFDDEYESNSSDYQSCYDEDFLEEIFSNPLFEEEIIPMKIDQHHFNAESDLIESMLNHDSSIIPSSLKIDSLLNEFSGELTHLKSIPPGIDETDCHPENEIRFIERLLYENSSPRPPDSPMEEIDLTFNPDDPMPPSIEEDDYDSERDVLILEELLDNYSISLPVIESYHFDIPSFFCPPAKPPDVVQYSWKFKDSCQRILSSKSLFPQLQLGIKYPNLID